MLLKQRSPLLRPEHSPSRMKTEQTQRVIFSRRQRVSDWRHLTDLDLHSTRGSLPSVRRLQARGRVLGEPGSAEADTALPPVE